MPFRPVDEKPGDQVVCPPALDLRGELVDGRARQRVPEADGPGTAVDVHQPGALRGLQDIGSERGRRGEQRAEVAGTEGGEQERPPGPRGQCVDLWREPLQQARAQREHGGPPMVGGAFGPSRRHGQLPQRERVPGGLGQHPANEVRRQAGNVIPDQAGGVGVVQRRNRQLR